MSEDPLVREARGSVKGTGDVVRVRIAASRERERWAHRMGYANIERAERRAQATLIRSLDRRAGE